MEFKIRSYQKQRGYLLVVGALLIVVVGVVGTMLAYMFTSNTRSAANVSQSIAALNIAQSALEIAKRDINGASISCDNYSRSGSVLNGAYSISGIHSSPNSNLLNAISSTDTTIPLASSSNFAASGIITIGNETITYTGFSGNNLTGATRGAYGTTPSGYNVGTKVSQNICVLTAQGGVPDLTNPDGKRTLRETMLGRALFGGGVDAVVYSYGNTVVNGNNISITNSVATRSGVAPNYIYDGHTLASRGSVTLNGNNDVTYVYDSVTGLLVPSSRSGSPLQGDIIQSYGSGLTVGQYFNLFFNPNVYPNYASLVNAATIIPSSSIQIINGKPSDVTFSGGDMIINGNGTGSKPLTVIIAGQAGGNMLQKWTGNIIANGNNVKVVFGSDVAGASAVVVTGNVTLNGNNNILVAGTTTTPTALVVGGNYLENGNNIDTALNGFFYAKGSVTFNGNNAVLNKVGIIVSETRVTFNGNNAHVVLDPTTITMFNDFGNMFNTYYASMSVNEVFY